MTKFFEISHELFFTPTVNMSLRTEFLFYFSDAIRDVICWRKFDCIHHNALLSDYCDLFFDVLSIGTFPSGSHRRADSNYSRAISHGDFLVFCNLRRWEFRDQT